MYLIDFSMIGQYNIEIYSIIWEDKYKTPESMLSLVYPCLEAK